MDCLFFANNKYQLTEIIKGNTVDDVTLYCY